MFTFIKKAIKTGTQTSSYPLEPMPVDKNFRGKPEHNPQQCIGCAACVNACPSNALTVETDLKTGELAWQFNLGRCIFCGRCEEVCPTHAIVLSKEFELAVMNKEDLEERCTYDMARCSECGEYYATVKQVDYATRILSQLPGDLEAQQAAALTGVCPKCKQKADAYRNKHRDELVGGKRKMEAKR